MHAGSGPRVRTSSVPAAAGGEPVRALPLPYGRHAVDDSDIQAVVGALQSGQLTAGAAVQRFESALAEFAGCSDAVAVSSGTAALHLALCALRVQPGSEVITSPLSFVASANAALYVGARPRFADTGPDFCLDAASVAATLTSATQAVVTVDYAGLPADVRSLRAAVRDIPIIRDAAHSLGGSVDGELIGKSADITTLSFHAVKHVTTGEGGACLTNDAELARRLRALRNHGMTSSAAEREGAAWQYDVTELGWNYRLADINAALGESQLRALPGRLRQREELARRYDTELAEVPGLKLPPRAPGRRHAWHLYVVLIDEELFGLGRDAFVDALRAEHIQATVHYPAINGLSLYRRLGYLEGTAPNAERVAAGVVTLPLFPSMTETDQNDVIRAIHRIAEWDWRPS